MLVAPFVTALFVLLIACAFGLVIGSFLNVVVLRTERGQSVGGRSACPHCGHTLSWYELIPVLSYILQRARCRSCKQAIALQYVIIEGVTAAVFMLVVGRHVLPVLAAQSSVGEAVLPALTVLTVVGELVAWSLLIVITAYDYRTKMVPNRFSYTFALIAFLLLLVPQNATQFTLPPILDLIAGPVLFAPFWMLWKVSGGRWIGLGDGKLALGIGWFLGLSEGFSAIIFAFWIGAAISLLLIALSRLRVGARQQYAKGLAMKSEVPFAPCMVLGVWIVYLTGVTLAGLVM